MGYALSGKTALVTGANRGIGEAIVDALVAAGHKSSDDCGEPRSSTGALASCGTAQLRDAGAELPRFNERRSVEVRRPERVQPANNFLAIHRASFARCGPSISAPATAPSNNTTSARAVAFASFTPAALVHSRKRSVNHSR